MMFSASQFQSVLNVLENRSAIEMLSNHRSGFTQVLDHVYTRLPLCTGVLKRVTFVEKNFLIRLLKNNYSLLFFFSNFRPRLLLDAEDPYHYFQTVNKLRPKKPHSQCYCIQYSLIPNLNTSQIHYL